MKYDDQMQRQDECGFDVIAESTFARTQYWNPKKSVVTTAADPEVTWDDRIKIACDPPISKERIEALHKQFIEDPSWVEFCAQNKKKAEARAKKEGSYDNE
jgi:hypothetical protein